MTEIIGHRDERRAFREAAASGNLHHAWLFTGPAGVGKALVATSLATELLADGSGLSRERTGAMIAAGSHPDFRLLSRQPKDREKPDGDLARSIPIAQVRSLQSMFATKPSLSDRRVVIIDAIDDLEPPAANALLKNLEEPPHGTIFLAVSHAPGRLLPTIRSRCRLLRFGALSREDVGRVLRTAVQDADDAEIEALTVMANGSPGRSLAFAGLDLAAIERDMQIIATEGDPTNAVRVRLAKTLGAKASQLRYEAFLERAPAFIASAARERSGAALAGAIDAYHAATSLAGAARGLSLDAGGSVFEMAGIIARLAPRSI